MKINNDQIVHLVQHVLNELDRQSRVLIEMEALISKQSVLLEDSQPYYFQKAHQEKQRLLDLIRNHHEKLLDFKTNWCNSRHEISVEIEERIQSKIEEIARTANNILAIEKGNYLIAKEGY